MQGVCSLPGLTIPAQMVPFTVFNVWFIIWPHQKVIIATTAEAAAKGQAPEGLAGRARTAFLASRTNTMLSIPMLFFMAAARHMNWLG